MNEQLIKDNKIKLEGERERLLKILKSDATKDGKGEFPGDYKPEFPEVGREEGENASEVEQFANNLAVTVDMESRLKKVEAALERIASGTYGKCSAGDDIEEERLRANPEAETCMKHASE